MFRNPLSMPAGCIALVACLGLVACSSQQESVDQRISSQRPLYLYSGTYPQIPSSAIQLRDWRGDRLAHTTTSNGTIYLYDASDERLVYSSYLPTGSEFNFTSESGRATVNGRAVFDAGPLNHSYQAFFDSRP